MNILKITSAVLFGAIACIGGVKSTVAAEHKTAGLKDTSFLPQKTGDLVPVAAENGLYGYMTPQGSWAIPPRFVAANPFTDDGLAKAWGWGGTTDNGFIDASGKWAIPPKFSEANDFDSSGLAGVGRKGKWGFINHKGKWVIPPKFDSVYNFSANGLTSVYFGGFWLMSNVGGELRVHADYPDPRPDRAPMKE